MNQEIIDLHKLIQELEAQGAWLLAEECREILLNIANYHHKDYYMKYDLFTHGSGVFVKNIKTRRLGKVQIRETAPEWIEPFVDYGDGNYIKENSSDLEVVNVYETNNPKR